MVLILNFNGKNGIISMVKKFQWLVLNFNGENRASNGKNRASKCELNFNGIKIDGLLVTYMQTVTTYGSI